MILGASPDCQSRLPVPIAGADHCMGSGDANLPIEEGQPKRVRHVLATAWLRGDCAVA